MTLTKMIPPQRLTWLSQEEVDGLLRRLMDRVAPTHPSDEEAQRLIAWAEEVRLNEGLLSLVLDGKAEVRFDVDGMPRF